MAPFTVAAGETGAYAKSLSAATVAEWDFATAVDAVEIITDGTADVYYTIDGTDPAVAGNASRIVPKLSGYRVVDLPGSAPPTIKLISAGTPVCSVCRYTGRAAGL